MYTYSNRKRRNGDYSHRAKRHRARRDRREPLVRVVRPPVYDEPYAQYASCAPRALYENAHVVWSAPTPPVLVERPAPYTYLFVLLTRMPALLVRLTELVLPRDIPLVLRHVPLWQANSYLFSLAPDASAALFLLAARRSLGSAAYNHMRPNPALWRVALEAMLHAIDCGGVHPPRPSTDQLELVFREARAGTPTRAWCLEDFGAPHCPAKQKAVEDETTETEESDNALERLRFLRFRKKH